MRGADTANDEFEVGFNRTFERHWYRAELAGRVIIILVVAASMLGLLGRGPFSHASRQSVNGLLSIDCEPVARHSASKTIPVHIKAPHSVDHPVQLL